MKLNLDEILKKIKTLKELKLNDIFMPITEVEELIRQNEVMKKALSFYAKEKHIIHAHDTDWETPGDNYDLYDINFLEDGATAREALKEIE